MITIFFIAYLQATRKQQQQHGQHSLVRVPAAAVVVAIVVRPVVVIVVIVLVVIVLLLSFSVCSFLCRCPFCLLVATLVLCQFSPPSSVAVPPFSPPFIPSPLSSLHLLMVLTVLVSFCNIYRLAIYFSFSLLHSRRAAELPICLPFCDSLCRPHGVVEGG